ncbi:hypothetical protein PAXRUDRAFT_772825, partial [Paxillus rubicundulus Ve08.2h10]
MTQNSPCSHIQLTLNSSLISHKPGQATKPTGVQKIDLMEGRSGLMVSRFLLAPLGKGTFMLQCTPPASAITATAPLPAKSVTTNPLPSTQYRFSFGLEDNTAPKCVLNQVPEASIPMPVKDLFVVSPDFRKQFCNMTMTKWVTTAPTTHVNGLSMCVPVVHINELSGWNLGGITREYGDQLLKSNDGLIVAHHSLPLHCLEVKVNGMERMINCILDSRSEIVAMPCIRKMCF